MVIAKPHLSVKNGSCGHSKGLSRVSRTARVVIAKPHLSVKNGSCGHSKGLSRVATTARVVIAKASLECQERGLAISHFRIPFDGSDEP